jgi:hypothetical protein
MVIGGLIVSSVDVSRRRSRHQDYRGWTVRRKFPQWLLIDNINRELAFQKRLVLKKKAALKWN